MVSPAVKEIEQVFCDFWSKSLAVNPAYKLDHTWPSLSVLDLLTDSSRGRTDLIAFEERVLTGAAAYLAVMAKQCWEAFGAKVVVEDRGYGILIRATEGPLVGPDEQPLVLVEQELRKLLKTVPREIPVFRNFPRPLGPAQSIMYPFAIGLFTGLTPAMQGGWKELRAEDWRENLDKVVRHLAIGCADHYGRLFPDEPLGQVAELYLNDLVFPPMLMAEDWPGRLAVQGICKFFKDFQVPKQKAIQLAFNLAACGDEVSSYAGFAIYSALVEDRISPKFVSLAQSKGVYVSMLRPAMIDARTYLGLSPEWADEKEITPEMERRIALEQRLGFLPWLRLSARRVARSAAEPGIRRFVEACLSFQLETAREVIDELVDEDPGDIDLRVQQVYLYVIGQDLDTAVTTMRTLLSEPEAEDNADVAYNAGLIELAAGNIAAAERHLKRSLKSGSNDAFILADLYNSVGWSRFVNEDHQGAVEAYDMALEQMPMMLVTLLNKAGALFRMGLTTPAQEIAHDLAQTFPYDRRVFMCLFLNVVNRMFGAQREEERAAIRNIA